MMEHYDRAVCTAELRPRNSVLRKIRGDSWGPTPAFQAPAVDGKPCDAATETPGADDLPNRETDTASAVNIQISLGMDVIDSDFEEVDIADLFSTDAFL